MGYVAASLWYVRWLSVLDRRVRRGGEGRRLAARIGVGRKKNRPNTAEPLPDIAACDAPARRSAEMIRPISGYRAATGASRSLWRTRLRSADTASFGAAGQASNHAKASFVLTPNAGSTRTTHAGGGSARRNSRSPRSRPSTAPPSRKYGTSAPSASAAATSFWPLTRQRFANTRKAAAASLLPPPNPAC